MAYSKDEVKFLTPNIGVFSSYSKSGFFIDGNNIYLVDTGTSLSDGNDILTIISSLFPEKKIRAILNTHSHSDHCGGNAIIVEKTNAEIWAPELESHIIAFPDLSPASCWGGNPFNELRNPVFVTEKNSFVTKTINEKEIDLERISIKAIPLPGHFLDQTGYLILDKTESKSVFFLGDGFFGSSMLKKFWIPFMYDPVKFRSSVERIEHTAADFYVPSHGEIYTKENIGGISEINMIVTYELESLISNMLKSKPMTQENLLKACADYAEIKLKMNQYILIGSTIRSYLSSMYDRGMIYYEIQDNQMLWFAK